MHTTIRFRLTAWYTAALAVTLLLFGSATFLLSRAGLYHWLDETLAERAEALSEEVRLVNGSPTLDLTDQGHGAYEGVSDGFLILDGSRNVVIARGIEPERVAAADAVTAGMRGEPSASTMGSSHANHAKRWRLASHPVLSGGRVAVLITVAHDLAEVDEVLERLAFVMVVLLPLALLGAGIGGYSLAGRVLAPVDRTASVAAAISERDLSQRLPVTGRDELARLAITFNALIERLQRAFERQRRFTADASHELRTPLSVIQAISSQKLMRRRNAEEYAQALRQINEAADYMGKLVTHLLMLARADAGQVELEQERIDLGELLEHVVAQVGEASRRNIPVEVAGDLRIIGDRMRLTELFLNLLENAMKYTPPEGAVAIRAEAIGSSARVLVQDTGIGVPPEHLPHIFERFYRVDKARARDEGGSGLGLAIGRWITEAHGGAIRAESEPGRGTTMAVILPLTKERSEE